MAHGLWHCDVEFESFRNVISTTSSPLIERRESSIGLFIMTLICLWCYINISEAFVVDSMAFRWKDVIWPRAPDKFPINHNTDITFIVLLSSLTFWVRLSKYFKIDKYYNLSRWDSKIWWILDHFYTLDRVLICVIVGGVSAAVSKTAAAPIERVKLLIQNQVCLF